MRQQGLAQNDQKWKFRAKCGHFWGKTPNYYWGKQKLWYPYNGKKHLGTLLVCIVFSTAGALVVKTV